jgi:chromosome segregation and condensation protein ScpB
MEYKLHQIIEALLLSASRPVSIEEIEKVFVENPPSREEIRNSLNEIEENCLNRVIDYKSNKISLTMLQSYGKKDLRDSRRQLWKLYH